MSAPSQDYSATITWTQDWSTHLTTNGGLTIATGAATCSDARVTVGTPTVTGANTSVTFQVSQTGIVSPTMVDVVVTVTLSNGDTDQRNFPILFTDT